MMKKIVLILVTLLVIAPNIHADRLDDAVRASNFEDVNYLLIMKGNAVSQHRKDELVLLANEMTLRRKRGTIPAVGTVWDAYATAKGIAATAITIACAKRIYTVRLQQDQREGISISGGFQYGLFGATGAIAGIMGIYYLIQGLRSAHGRDLYAQAEQIEARINELKVVGHSTI